MMTRSEFETVIDSMRAAFEVYDSVVEKRQVLIVKYGTESLTMNIFGDEIETDKETLTTNLIELIFVGGS